MSYIKINNYIFRRASKEGSFNYVVYYDNKKQEIDITIILYYTGYIKSSQRVLFYNRLLQKKYTRDMYDYNKVYKVSLLYNSFDSFEDKRILSDSIIYCSPCLYNKELVTLKYLNYYVDLFNSNNDRDNNTIFKIEDYLLNEYNILKNELLNNKELISRLLLSYKIRKCI